MAVPDSNVPPRDRIAQVKAGVRICLTILFSRGATFLLAIVIVSSMFLPWQVAAPRVYPGLDPNLIFVNERGSGTHSGKVAVTGNGAVITATAGSNPTIHLVDSESDFTSELDVTPLATASLWEDAKVVVHPPAGARYFAVLLGAVEGTILFSNIAVTPEGSGLTRATFSDQFTDPRLSKWLPASGVDVVSTTDPSGHALRVTAAGSKEVGTYTGVIGPLPAVSTYEVTTQIRVASGTPRFKIALQWLDTHRRFVGYAPDWPDWAAFAQPFVPAMISVWHPRQNNAVNLLFTNSGTVAVVTQDALAKPTTTVLMNYSPGTAYHVRVEWLHAKSLTFRITGPDGQTVENSLYSRSGLGLFKESFVNLSVEALASPTATNTVDIQHVKLILPAETRFASNVSDLRLKWLTLAILAWVLAHIAYLTVRMTPAGFGARAIRFTRRHMRWRTLGVATVVAALCGVYVAASYLDGHPFDRLSQEGATYVINQYGIGAVYGRTSAFPDAVVRGGNPWSPAEFAYPPGMLSFFILVAKAWEVIRGSIVPMGDRSFYMFWKTGFALFIIVDAALIYLIARRSINRPSHWPWILALLFALNPALIFDVPIWGQSNAFLMAPILVAVWALQGRRPRLMWSAIVVAVLVKQTALLAVPLIAVFALRRFGLVRTLSGAAFGVAVGFAFVAPLILAGYHPATIYLATVGKVVDFGTPLTGYVTTVSADTFPIWVLFTSASGFHGHDRLWASDHAYVGPLHITYATAGLILFLLVTAGSVVLVWRAAKPGTDSFQRLFLVIALVVVAYVTLNTRTSGHYLVLALPFVILAIPRSREVAAVTLGAITASVLLSEYGLFMFMSVHGELPVFVGFGSPGTNGLSGVVYRLYTNDNVITLFAVMMIYVLLQLLVTTVTRPPRDLPSPYPGSPLIREPAASSS